MSASRGPFSITTYERYVVAPTQGVVQCECPEHLCTHPNGYRDVSEWVVVDTENRSWQSDEQYTLKREAVAHANRLNAQE